MKWLHDAKPEDVEPTKASEPTEVSPEPTLGCDKEGCQGKLRLHATGVGYLCEFAASKNDGHTRLNLAEYQAKLNAVQQARAG